MADASNPSSGGREEWFSQGPGLSFGCTMCGNCCTGPEGYVLVTEAETQALAARLGMTAEDFNRKYTNKTSQGRSLNEHKTEFGYDCIFLDRDKFPGKAVCGVYEDRPAQCRTWPFWKSNLTSKIAWERAKRTCPGIDKGKLYPVQQIRIQRDVIDI
jgi:uncharacterized protein